MATLKLGEWVTIATGASKTYGGARNCRLRLDGYLNSQDTAANKSNVTIRLVLLMDSGYIGNYQATNWSLSGTLVNSGNLGSGDYYNGTTLGSKTGDISHNSDGTKTFSESGGFDPTAWGQTLSVSGSADLPKINRAPIVGALSISSIARTSAAASFSVTEQGASTVSASSIKASLTSGSYSSPVATITGTSSGVSGTLSGLAANTKYYVRGEATNTIGTTYTTETNFTTTGNAPTISSITSSPSKNYATLTGNVSYDTNASFSSVEVQWGTSTSYGNTSNAWRIPASGSTLAQNTTYYYRARVTDNWNRTSSWKTGSFTTTGDNPTITNVVATPNLQYCDLAISVTYATNASYNTMTVQYGTTTSYGSTATTFGNGWATLTPLNSKQTYYYKITVKDNFNRTSSAYTGSFTTTSSAPWDAEPLILNVTETSAEIGVTYSVGAPDWVTAGSITVSGNGYNTTKNFTFAGDPPTPNTLTFTGLTANKTYTVTGSVTNTTGTTNITSTTFTTPPTAPSISSVTVQSSGTTGISISVTASGGSGDTLQYRFSSDGGSNWTNLQTGSTKSYTGLTAGNTYNVCLEVRNGDRFVYEYYTITLPTSSSTTTKGLIQYRQDGWWTNVKKVYIAKYSKWLSK